MIVQFNLEAKMMIRKIGIAAVFAGAGLMLAGPAHAGSYFYAGKWYYYSLNFEALIAKVTGKDLKDGTFVGAEVKITSPDTACSNPQTKVINPGKGPEGTVSGTSPNIDDDDLVKKDRVQGNIFQTTASILDLVPEDERLNPPAGVCKDAPGASEWLPLFWQDRNCDKGKAAQDLQFPICYKDYAAFVDGFLTYVTGDFEGSRVTTNTSEADWTYVYLPTAFKFKAEINTGTSVYSQIYGSCRFPLNPANGEPYSITNPPADGWAALPPVYYDCIVITADEYLY
jgi:hypothetical protein